MILIDSENYFWKKPREHYHSLPKTILFVSAFKDIGRGSWKNSGRSVDQYVSWFSNVATRIKYPLVVFVEEPVRKRLSQYTLSPTMTIHDLNEVNTFFTHYVEKEREIMESASFKSKIHPDRRDLAETTSAEYNLVNHSKINFVRHAKDLYPEHDFYSWIDFGMFRDLDVIPRDLRVSEYPTNFIFHALSHPGPKRTEEDMLHTNQVFLTGSTFVIPRDQVDSYEQLYENKIKAWQKRGISDDDQSLILQLYYDNRDKFHLVEDGEWFRLFRKLPHD